MSLLTTREAAAYLRESGIVVTQKTVERWLREGRLRGIRTPGNHWRVSRDALRDVVQGGDAPTN